MRPDLTTATTTVRRGAPGGELDLAGLGALRAVGVRFSSAGARSVRVEGLTDAGVWRVVAERAAGPVVTGWSAPAAGVVRRLRVVGDDPAGSDHAALRAWCLTDPDRAVVDDAVVTASSHHPWHPPEAVLDLPVTRSWWAAVDDPAPVLTLRRSGGGPISVLRLLAAAPATDPAVPPSDPGPDPRPDPTVRPLLPTVEVAPTPDGPWRSTDDPTPDGPGWLAHRLPADTVAVRLTGARGLAAVELLASPGGAPPDDAVPVLPWWSTGSPVMRYFPKHYGVDFAQVTAELPELRRRGFTVIELAGIKQGPPSAFAGLGATDDYAVDHRLGDLAGLRGLIAAAHAHGIRVIAFDNLGYAHRSAPAFTAAASRVAADPDADPYPFLIRTQAPDPTAPRADRWFRDPDSGAWYFAYWGEDLPSYDWHREAWREESSRIMRFWLDQGLDGLGIDAPAAYPGSDAAAERRHIGDVLADAGAWGFPEGIPAAPEGQRQTEWQRMVVEQRFTAVLDLSLTVWHSPRENRLLPAVESEDPAVLEPLLAAGRDAVAAVGGTTIEAPAWEADLMPAAAPGEGTDGDGTPTTGEHAAIGVGDGTHPVAVVPADRRLLEIACLSLCGSMFYLTNGLHTYRAEVQVIPTWTAAEQVRLDRLLAAVGAEPALGPDGVRRLLPTADPRHVAWLRTDGTGRLAALVVLGFTAGPSTARVDLAGTGISTLGAELTGDGGPARSDGNDVDEGAGTIAIAVDLGPRGFAAYEVM